MTRKETSENAFSRPWTSLDRSGWRITTTVVGGRWSRCRPARSPDGSRREVDRVLASGGACSLARGPGTQLPAGTPRWERRRARVREEDGRSEEHTSELQ